VSIFRFGDPPVPDIDLTFGMILPPEANARQMVSSYFESVAPILHFVHMPTINSWLSDMLEEYKGIQSRPLEPSKKAVIFMILAAVQSHESAESNEGNADLRYEFICLSPRGVATPEFILTHRVLVSGTFKRQKSSWTLRQAKFACLRYKHASFNVFTSYPDPENISAGLFSAQSSI